MRIRDAIDNLKVYASNPEYGLDANIEISFTVSPCKPYTVSVEYHEEWCEEYRRKIKCLEELSEARAFRLQQFLDLADSFR